MYKVAFPGASDEDEKREMDWVGRGGVWATDTRFGRRLTPRALTAGMSPGLCVSPASGECGGGGGGSSAYL